MIAKSAEIIPVLYGVNAAMRTGIEARELGMKKVMVVYDVGVYNAGIVQPVIDNLKASRIEVVTFDKVVPDPPDTIVDLGGELARSEKINGIIAIGGGSVMDTAKAINVLHANPGPINQWFFPSEPQGEALPMIALPTTAGTGSEASFAAVVTVSAENVKGALLHHEFCKFSLSINDPKMYAGLPTKPTAYCAFDIITHCIDSLMSAFNERYSVMFAKTAIENVVKYLPRVLKNGNDLEARGEIAFAATLGGNCLNTNMAGNTHTFGHSLGTVCHLPHGLAVSLPLASLIELYYCKWRPERVKLVGECFGLTYTGDETPEEIGKMTAKVILKFQKDSGIETISQLDISKEELEKSVSLMTKDIQTPSTFVLLAASDYNELLEHMYTI